jgi:hypothetical protein
VTLYRAGDPKAARTEVRALHGRHRAGECYLIDGPGVSHSTLLEEPHVVALAAALTELLARADGATGEGP